MVAAPKRFTSDPNRQRACPVWRFFRGLRCRACSAWLRLAACSFLPLVGWQRGRVQRLWESKSKSKRESSRAWPSRQCNGRACTGSEPPWDARGAAQGRHRQDQCRVFAACFAIESVAASAGRACAGAVFCHFFAWHNRCLPRLWRTRAGTGIESGGSVQTQRKAEKPVPSQPPRAGPCGAQCSAALHSPPQPSTSITSAVNAPHPRPVQCPRPRTRAGASARCCRSAPGTRRQRPERYRPRRACRPAGRSGG